MKLCLNCQNEFDSIEKICPQCGCNPDIVDGFIAYAPDLIKENNGFREESFSKLVRLEDNNFWFQIRNKLIVDFLRKYTNEFDSFLEIGSGTGFVLRGVRDAYKKAKLSGSEIFVAGLNYAQERLPGIELFQMDARSIPFVEEFDVVGAFDVIEHIDEHDSALKNIHRALRPGGTLLLTVPQHKWLWSMADDYACHKRRYNAPELFHLVERAGFDIQRSTSFVTILLPIMFLSRLLQKVSGSKNYNPEAELSLPPAVNSCMKAVLEFERFLINLGINLPIGGSRILIARKRA